MKTIKLYGHLAKKFGKTFHFDVKTPAEAIRMLRANFKDFTDYMVEHSEPGYHVFVAKNNIGAKQLTDPCSDDEVIKIVPVVAGAKQGVFQTILGVTLMVVGFLTWNPFLFNMGVALTLGGIAQMLFAPNMPSGSQDQTPNNLPSYSFDGAVNTTRQGNPVSICYGKMIVGSQVISAGMFSEAI